MRVAIVLGAGRSTRFGTSDKLLSEVRGRPLLADALDRAAASDARRILLVTRRRSPRVGRLAAGCRRIRLVWIDAPAVGLSDSLRAGLAALRPIEREAWIFLGDMPRARARCGIRLRPPFVAARPLVAGAPGHPMLVRVDAARAVLGTGDRGLGAALPRGTVMTWRGTRDDLLDLDDRGAVRRYRYRR